MAKQYADAGTYESKLEKVMRTLEVDKYDYNWDRFSCWVELCQVHQNVVDCKSAKGTKQ